ncbi:MAG: FHA domain-containing protein [Pseudomonadota bacterium]|nr:FHA domain-containing protein [Pseudomonadota bacterium]
MSMKSWVLQRVQRLGAAAGRGDLPPRDAAGTGSGPEFRWDAGNRTDLGIGKGTLAGKGDAARDGTSDGNRIGPEPGAAPSLADADNLGAYAPLINAVRDELEHFVASHIRLHVVIADRDRFAITAIGVRALGGARARDLLHQFIREFRPEQVKRYLAREVIARLPNGTAIDLAQFGGLSDLEMRNRAEEDPEYGELLAALQAPPPAALGRPYEVSVLGRWIESESGSTGSGPGPRRSHTPATPLAGRRCEFDIEDAEGPRRAALDAVLPGRRYVVGKDEHCDLRISGTYSSRRHAELWFEAGSWHVADAGSTNGIRVESAEPGAAKPGETRAAPAGSTEAITVREGMRIVLSARAEGPPADYPWLALRSASRAAQSAGTTPIAAPAPAPAAVTAPAKTLDSMLAPLTTPDVRPMAAAAGMPSTPRTAVFGAGAAEPVFEILQPQGGAAGAQAIRRGDLPIGIGRSRDQTLVIDWSHQGVSGHHVEIDVIDDGGVEGVVQGDNGVDIGSEHHVTGARFRWSPGQTLVLGGAWPGEPPCTLTLARPAVH